MFSVHTAPIGIVEAWGNGYAHALGKRACVACREAWRLVRFQAYAVPKAVGERSATSAWKNFVYRSQAEALQQAISYPKHRKTPQAPVFKAHARAHAQKQARQVLGALST